MTLCLFLDIKVPLKRYVLSLVLKATRESILLGILFQSPGATTENSLEDVYIHKYIHRCLYLSAVSKPCGLDIGQVSSIPKALFFN